MSEWIPIEDVELEFCEIYWLKVEGEVINTPAQWVGDAFSGGRGWPIHRSLVSHVIKLTKPEA